jgi:hypothetical protein
MGRGFDWFTDALKIFGTWPGPRTQTATADSEATVGRAPSPAPEASYPDTAITVANPIRIERAADIDAPPDVEAAPKVDAITDLEVAPDVEAGSGVETAPIVATAAVVEAVPDPLDGERRRDMVRELFNGYWDGMDDKPPTFAERLDAAENYINERLAERNMGWRLDAETRKQLGLPRSRLPLRSASPP